MPRDSPSPVRCWLLRRTRLFTHGQMAEILAWLCTPTLLVSIMFAAHGYWHMLAFCMIVWMAVICCLIVCIHRGRDFDSIVIADGTMLVEQRRSGRLRWASINSCSARITLPAGPADPIIIEDRGVRLAIGDMVSPAERRQLALQLCIYLPNIAVRCELSATLGSGSSR
jgi:uncharacterized membrane protein